ncbi:dihydroorotate dehydrogenase (quinone) [mine drainage metagenome]|uniref:dihydroorotate dehydrogenase (quinone) n=1 Tax=mine drainage metagenome TaxID=410659 RepID=A0A1J5T665_9ZZZZ
MGSSREDAGSRGGGPCALPFEGAPATVPRMDLWYEKVLRPYFFRQDPEVAHERAVHALARLGSVGWARRALERWAQLPPARFQPVRLFGLEFPNRIGLAAGFDKNGAAWLGAAALGFGHVEIGTITGEAQPGNPKPRLFRYPEHEAVINRMGFNNEGAAAVARRLASMPARGHRPIPLGINLGKTKVVPLEQAVADYLKSFALLADHADYVVLNVSSPNTPDLRRLQDEDRLRELLGAVTAANRARTLNDVKARVPILLKIAPDLTWPQVDSVLQVIADHGLDGIVATNTTLARPGPFASAGQAGGLSGAPLRRRSTEFVSYIARATGGRLPIIGVGGVSDGEGAGEKLDAGASLVQVYSGLIYRGPFFARDLARAVCDRDRR